MKHGKAQQTGKIGEIIDVKIGDKRYKAQAVTEVNSSDVVLFKGDKGEYVAACPAAGYSTKSEERVKRKRPKKKKPVEAVTYPVKVLVVEETESEWKFWLGGDRKTPEVIFTWTKEIINDPESYYDGEERYYLYLAYLENTGPGLDDWMLYIQFEDAYQNLYLPIEYRIGELDTLFALDNYILVYNNGFKEIFVKPGQTKIYDGENTAQRYFLPYGEYIGGGMAATKAPYLWLNGFAWNFADTSLGDIQAITEEVAYPWIDDYFTIIFPSQDGEVYLPNGLNVGQYVPSVPNTNRNDYTATHQELREELNPFAGGSDWITTVGNPSLNDFEITLYTCTVVGWEPGEQGYYISFNPIPNPENDYFNQFYRSRNYENAFVASTPENHPTHQVATIDTTKTMVGAFGLKHLPPYIHEYRFRMNWKNDPVNKPFSWEDHWCELYLTVTDTAYMPVSPTYTIDELSERHIPISASRVNVDVQLSNNRDRKYSSYKESVNTTVDLKGVTKPVTYDQINYSHSNNLIETGRYWKRGGTIPYLYFAGNNSFIVAEFTFEEAYLTPMTWSETYTLCIGGQETEITDLGGLSQTWNFSRYFGSPGTNLYADASFATLVNRDIYFVNDSDAALVMAGGNKVKVTQWNISNSGVIPATGNVTEYDAYPMNKTGNQFTLYTASYYPI